MGAFFGDAAIVWDSTGGQQNVYHLRAPLRASKNAFRQRRYTRDSLDYSAREVSVVGAGVHEIEGDVRYDDAGQTLVEMLRAGMNGTTLTYIPSLSDQDRSWDTVLVSPSGDSVTGSMDTDRGFPGFEEQMTTIRLRITDGDPFV